MPSLASASGNWLQVIGLAGSSVWRDAQGRCASALNGLQLVCWSLSRVQHRSERDVCVDTCVVIHSSWAHLFLAGHA